MLNSSSRVLEQFGQPVDNAYLTDDYSHKEDHKLHTPFTGSAVTKYLCIQCNRGFLNHVEA